jgi:gluconokinase
MLDRLDPLLPVVQVRATGGALRAPLWREALAAMLGRPLEVVADADGTALGAAALGMLALGRVEDLADAGRWITRQGALGPATHVPVDADAAATYDLLRASIGELLGELAPVAQLFAG